MGHVRVRSSWSRSDHWRHWHNWIADRRSPRPCVGSRAAAIVSPGGVVAQFVWSEQRDALQDELMSLFQLLLEDRDRIVSPAVESRELSHACVCVTPSGDVCVPARPVVCGRVAAPSFL